MCVCVFRELESKPQNEGDTHEKGMFLDLKNLNLLTSCLTILIKVSIFITFCVRIKRKNLDKEK